MNMRQLRINTLFKYVGIKCITLNTLIFFYIFMPSWRNWISRLTSNQKSVGSSPTGGNYFYIILFLFSDYYYLDLIRR
jgi:hypothetical protein